MSNNPISLGLDISSTTIGYCFSSSQENIIHAGFVSVNKENSIKKKAHKVADELKNTRLQPCFIIVEDSLSGFGGGRTSQQTIVKLAKCNAIISYVVEEMYNIEVEHINVSTMRKAVFGKSRESGVDSKTFVKNNLDNMLDLSEFTHYNTKKNYDKKNYDMLDAVVASLYHWYSE
jgi:RNase H-fold protein (predicted Holliday junction resolvase)